MSLSASGSTPPVQTAPPFAGRLFFAPDYKLTFVPLVCRPTPDALDRLRRFPEFLVKGFSEVRVATVLLLGRLPSTSLLLHVVRETRGEVARVFPHELGEGARLAAADSSDDIRHRFPGAPAVG